MKLGGRERVDDSAALEELFEHLTVSADWTVGFLTAVCTGPDAISPAVWIPEVVPEGAFDDDPKARAKVDVLARLYGAVGETLRTTPEIICPEPDKAAQEAVDFCTGYLRGAGMHETWRKDEAATAKLVPFESLAKEGADATHRERLGSYVAEGRAERALSVRQREEAQEVLPREAGVNGHRFASAWRRRHARPSPTVGAARGA
jgi:yecA family protein